MIIYRSVKGGPLSHDELDGNFVDVDNRLITLETAVVQTEFTDIAVGNNLPGSHDGTAHIHTESAGVVTASLNADDLVVENNAAGGISILTPDAVSSSLMFGNPTSNVAGQIFYNNTTNEMGFSTNATQRLSLITGLIVGAPTGGDKGAGSINASALYINDVPVTAGPSYWTQTGSDIYYNTGNVGIGTSAPEAPLHILNTSAGTVDASTDADNFIIESNLAAGMSILVPNGIEGKIAFGSPSSALGGNYISWNYNASFEYMRFHIDSIDIMAITGGSGGRVGIHTNAPASTLDVNGIVTLSGSGTSILTSTDASGLTLDANTAGGMFIQSDGEIWIRGSAGLGYSTLMRISTDGKVGIRTVASYRLDLLSDTNDGIRIYNGTNQIYLGNISAIPSIGTISLHAMQFIINSLTAFTIDTDLGIYTVGATGGSQGSGTLNATAIYVNGTELNAANLNYWTLSGSDIYYNTGNVGIGETTPLYPLTIVGSDSQISFYSATGIGRGGFLTSQAAGWSFLSGGAERTSGLWAARAVNASIISVSNGVVDIFTDTGLTLDASFTPTTRLSLANDGGLFMAGATGSSQGSGTINATGLYIDGVAVLPGGGYWTLSGSDIYFATGNVGVGTSVTPDSVLHVNPGAAGVVTANTNADELVVEHSTSGGINILVPDNAAANLFFGSPSVNNGGRIQWAYSSNWFQFTTSNAGGYIVFKTSTEIEAMTIAADQGTYTAGATGGSQGSGTINTTGLYIDGVAVLPGGGYWTLSGSDIYFATGNVGVGTSVTPDSVLHVNPGAAGVVTANTNADELVVEHSTTGGVNILVPDAAAANLFFGSPSATNGGRIQWAYSSDWFQFGTNKATGYIVFKTSTDVEAMTIAADQGTYTTGATGGSQGSGTINATGLYINGTPVGTGGGYWSLSGSNIYYSTGKVGIGTSTTPDGNLHIGPGTAGAVTAHGAADEFVIESAATGGMTLLTTASNINYIMFASTNNIAEGIINYVHGATTNTGHMEIHVASTQIVTITSGLDVGVGISTPDGKLHVHSASAGVVTADTTADDLVVENSGDGGITVLTPDANVGKLLFGNPASNVGAGIVWDKPNNSFKIGPNTTNANISLRTGAFAEAVTISSTKQVGINTASPDGSLHVHTNSAGTVTADTNANNLVVEDGDNCGISILSPDASFGILSFGSPSNSAGAFINWSNTLAAYTIGTNVAGADLEIQTGAGATAMFITSAQKVGIGTSTPNAATTLDVVGTIRASTGILFGSDTAAANTLNDYEEGTFSPVLWDSSNSDGEGQTYSSQYGTYTKIGKVVFYKLHMTMSSLGTLTAGEAMRIGGFPYGSEISSDYSGGVVFYVSNLTGLSADQSLTARMPSNSIYLSIYKWGAAGGPSSVLISDLASNTEFQISGSYFV